MNPNSSNNKLNTDDPIDLLDIHGNFKYDINELVARYQYQVLIGCGSPQCNRPFCRNNQNSLFAGKVVAPSATTSLTLHLASSKGVYGLCRLLQQKVLPDEVAQLINTIDPLQSPALVNAREDPILKKKRQNTISSVLCNTDSFKRRLVSRVLEAAASMVPNLSWNPAVSVGRMFKTTQMTSAENSSADHEEYSTTEVRQLIAHLKSKNFNGRALTYYSYVLMGLSSTQMEASLRLPMTIFWGLHILGGDTWKAPSNSYPWILYRHSNAFLYWPAASSVSVAKSVREFVENKDTRKKIAYESYNGLNSLFLRYQYLAGQAISITEIPQGVKWTRDMVRLGLMRTALAVLARGEYVNTISKFSNLIERQSNLRESKDTFAVDNYRNILSNNWSFVMVVDRQNFLQSAIEELRTALDVEDTALKPLQVVFSSEELTQDFGGVQLEFFSLLGEHLVSSTDGHALFCTQEESNFLWFNLGYMGDIRIYEYIGILVGMGLYNQCLVGVKFPVGLYDLLQRSPSAIWPQRIAEKIIKDLDPQELFNIKSLSVQNHLADYSFEYTYRLDTGEVISKKLPSYEKYGGQVTNDNLSSFKSEYIFHRTLGICEPAIRHFVRGFQFVINMNLVNKLSSSKLQEMIEGENHFSVDEYAETVKYEVPEHRSSLTAKLFWEVMHELDQIQLRQFLQFITGSKNVPVGGMKTMDLSIFLNGASEDLLPTSSTCGGILHLPRYTSKSKLKEMLLIALEHVSGFGLA